MDINILSIAAKFNSFLAQNIYSIAGAVACAYSIAKLYNFEKKQVKNTWKRIMKENNLVNKDGETFNIKIEKADYGYMLIVRVPTGYSFIADDKYKAMTPYIDDKLIRQYIRQCEVKKSTTSQNNAIFIPSKEPVKPKTAKKVEDGVIRKGNKNVNR